MLEKLFSKGWIGKKSPEIDAVAWLNSKPLSIEQLMGKAVLIDFWTYSCINCQRTLPYLRRWHEKYAKKGLVIVGVHSPEFEFEKDINNVKSAVKKYQINYPVALDSDYKTWKNFRNQWWPRKLIVNQKGMIVYDHVGEGAYDETEKVIINLLGIKPKQQEPPVMQSTLPEITPEIYCGMLRNQGLGNGIVCMPGECGVYSDPRFHKPNTIYLDGEWSQHDEYLQHERKRGHLALKYTASEVNAVMSAVKPARSEVLLNDKPLTKESAGTDIVFDGTKSFVAVSSADLYNIIKGPYGMNELKIVAEGMLQIFAFTFG